MKIENFSDIINFSLDYMKKDCTSNPERYKKSGEIFEPIVVEAISAALTYLNLDYDVKIAYTAGGHSFPDIVLIDKNNYKYGIEVKSSTGTSKSWKINGNSILGSTKEEGILKTVIIFGKLHGENSEFRAKDYEKCITDIVVTHSPRYAIDMDIESGNTFFEKSGISYEELNTSNEPIKLITDYYSKKGLKAWWLAESTPAVIKQFNTLSKKEQKYYIGYAFAHFPELFSSTPTKFYRLMSWLASEHGIVDSCLRDRFTAGGKDNIETKNNTYYKLPHIYKTLHDHRKEIINELKNGDRNTLKADWNCNVPKKFENRINKWIYLVIYYLHISPDKQDSIFRMLNDLLS